MTLKYSSAPGLQLSVVISHVSAGDFMRNYDNLVAKLLEERDIHVMIYAGVKDLICNWYALISLRFVRLLCHDVGEENMHSMTPSIGR